MGSCRGNRVSGGSGRTPCRLWSRRYSRFGNLRYAMEIPTVFCRPRFQTGKLHVTGRPNLDDQFLLFLFLQVEISSVLSGHCSGPNVGRTSVLPVSRASGTDWRPGQGQGAGVSLNRQNGGLPHRWTVALNSDWNVTKQLKYAMYNSQSDPLLEANSDLSALDPRCQCVRHGACHRP